MKTGIPASVAKHMRKEYGSVLVGAFRHGPDMDAPYTLLTGSVSKWVVGGKLYILPTAVERGKEK
jgi:hypothetical protein